MKASSFASQVYWELRRVPYGQVTTYKDLAQAIGVPGGARAVGNAMNKNPFAPKVPCHRVVKSNGQIGGFAQGTKEKIRLLKKEEVMVKGTKVLNFEKILYKF